MDTYLSFVAEIGAIPTNSELHLKARQDSGFPATSTFLKRLGQQSELLRRVHSHGLAVGFDPKLLKLMEDRLNEEAVIEVDEQPLQAGSVYLLKSGQHYKIGRSSEIERRIKQIGIALPEAVELVHAIQTDDTVGIELYWHRRFSDKRLRGEWFSLSTADIRAFKRRKFQ